MWEIIGTEHLMSNRQQRRQAAQGLGKGLSELMRNTQAQVRDAVGEEEQEDLNILPMPLSQEIKSTKTADWIEWTWEPVGLGIKIIGILYTQDSSWETDVPDKKQGTYEVQLSLRGEQSVHTFDPTIAKPIGQALISAANWVNIWKQHAGTFLEKDLFGYGTEGPKDSGQFHDYA
jgi:hypothetical protein